MNLALWLVSATAISGVLYCIDKFYKKIPANNVINKTLEWLASSFPVLITVLVIRTFIAEPFRIPSGSLEPTLLIGDFLFVNKFIYGLRLPVTDTKILDIGHPKVGDIVVFRWPVDPSYNYIKRVVGAPGDVVKYTNKVISVNGVVTPRKFKHVTVDPSSGYMVYEFEETLNGVTHDIFTRHDVPAVDFEVKVPPHSYFMMGDNRDDSADSRYWGFVDEQYLRGKAAFIWFSIDIENYKIRWKRIGQMIKP
jgi:signal peptidase I